MGLQKDHDDIPSFSDINQEQETPEELNRKRHVRRKVDDWLERKRLKAELEDELDEFDWDDLSP